MHEPIITQRGPAISDETSLLRATPPLAPQPVTGVSTIISLMVFCRKNHPMVAGPRVELRIQAYLMIVRQIIREAGLRPSLPQ